MFRTGDLVSLDAEFISQRKLEIFGSYVDIDIADDELDTHLYANDTSIKAIRRYLAGLIESCIFIRNQLRDSPYIPRIPTNIYDLLDGFPWAENDLGLSGGLGQMLRKEYFYITQKIPPEMAIDDETEGKSIHPDFHHLFSRPMLVADTADIDECFIYNIKHHIPESLSDRVRDFLIDLTRLNSKQAIKVISTSDRLDSGWYYAEMFIKSAAR